MTIRRAFDRATNSSGERNYIYGRLGKPDGSGGYITKVTARPGYAYVRTGAFGDGSVTIALNNSVPYEDDRPVKMLRKKKGLVIVGSNDTLIEQFTRSAYYTGEVNPHTHQIGSGLEYELEAMRFAPGRVIYHTGLQVYIRPFRYFHNGAWDTWMGGLIYLGPYQPTTTDYWAWVLVGIDPDTNTAVAVKGTEYAQTTSLTIDLIDDISFDNYIPCTAIKVTDADTELSDIDDYQDAHGWINKASSFATIIDAIITDSDASLMVDADGNVMTES